MKTEQQHIQTKKFGLPHILLILGMAILLAGVCYFGYQLHSLSKEQEQIKEDYSMVNNITFGVFSVDQWREKMSDVVTRRIDGFKITKAQKKEMQEGVEKQLNGMVDKVVSEINRPQKTLGGKLKKFAFNQFVEPKELKEQTPVFAKTIIDKVNSPASTKRLKNIASSQFEKLASQTYDSTELAYAKVTKQTYGKYYVNGPAAFNKQIGKQLESIRKITYNYAYAMLGCLALAILLWFLLRKKAHLHSILFVMSLLFAAVFLFVGTTVSIIEVDARIQSLAFDLMGEKIGFDNQVLFFQSKSILGITEALIQQSKPDAIVVGALILLFVIILPILRMTARGIYMLASKTIAESKAVKYLAFESGKWDMADVMVVGILMTYIGLNGILKSQLTDLNIKNEVLSTLTINYTSLQPGYIIFVGYVIFAFTLSYFLTEIAENMKKRELPDPTL